MFLEGGHDMFLENRMNTFDDHFKQIVLIFRGQKIG